MQWMIFVNPGCFILPVTGNLGYFHFRQRKAVMPKHVLVDGFFKFCHNLVNPYFLCNFLRRKCSQLPRR